MEFLKYEQFVDSLKLYESEQYKQSEGHLNEFLFLGALAALVAGGLIAKLINVKSKRNKLKKMMIDEVGKDPKKLAQYEVMYNDLYDDEKKLKSDIFDKKEELDKLKHEKSLTKDERDKISQKSEKLKIELERLEDEFTSLNALYNKAREDNKKFKLQKSFKKKDQFEREKVRQENKEFRKDIVKSLAGSGGIHN